MIKQTITYEDYDGNSCTEDFYFNINTAELARIKNDFYGESLEKAIDKIKDTNDEKTTIDIYTKIILFAYGKKSEDGKRFMKSPEISKEFEESPAFSELFIKLAQNPDEMQAFMNGILPKAAK